VRMVRATVSSFSLFCSHTRETLPWVSGTCGHFRQFCLGSTALLECDCMSDRCKVVSSDWARAASFQTTATKEAEQDELTICMEGLREENMQ
jgi:hypothetical protein